DDAHRLLAALASDYEPAYVLGSSGGAIIGLDLVARHPEQVHTLIAHEPPTHLSSEHDPIQVMGSIRQTYLREGIEAAFQQLLAQPGLLPDGHEMDIEIPEPVDQEQRDQFINNAIFLFEREFPMIDRYQFDFAALGSASARSHIVIAGGASSHEDETYWSAVAVAELLGTTLVEFPGRHVGYVTNPAAFAQRLHEVLSETPLLLDEVRVIADVRRKSGMTRSSLHFPTMTTLRLSKPSFACLTSSENELLAMLCCVDGHCFFDDEYGIVKLHFSLLSYSIVNRWEGK